MNKLSDEILEKYQVRKTQRQKLQFIELIKNSFPNVCIEEGGAIKSRNIIVGDVDTAKVVFTAHYDTCAALPFPNLIFPRNIVLTVLYSLLFCVPLFVIMFLCNILLSLITTDFLIHYFFSLGLFFPLFLGMFVFGIPNKHTANDNTSGVVSLVELYDRLTPEEREKCAFVFFDNEENGLLGSAYFRRLHKNVQNSTLVINIDCVGDGENLMFVFPKKLLEELGDTISKSFEAVSDENLNVMLCKSSTTMYPSDQAGFKKGIGVATLHKNFLGYYLGRIHTCRDTVCEEKNIKFLCDGLRNLISYL